MAVMNDYFKPGDRVKYVGGNKEHHGNVFTIVSVHDGLADVECGHRFTPWTYNLRHIPAPEVITINRDDLVKLAATSDEIISNPGGKYDGILADAEFIAHARQDVPRLLAALDAVLALHVPVAVYSYNDVDGVFDLDEDGELIKLYEVCGTCTPGDTLEALGDCEFTDDDPYTIYPCPTLNAITEALEAS